MNKSYNCKCKFYGWSVKIILKYYLENLFMKTSDICKINITLYYMQLVKNILQNTKSHAPFGQGGLYLCSADRYINQKLAYQKNPCVLYTVYVVHKQIVSILKISVFHIHIMCEIIRDQSCKTYEFSNSISSRRGFRTAGCMSGGTVPLAAGKNPGILPGVFQHTKAVNEVVGLLREA